MDLQNLIDTTFGAVLTALIGFGTYIMKQLNNKPSREEVRQLITDKQEAHIMHIAELKEDIHRLETKIDKLVDRELDNKP